jgi:hypothetical protein
MARTARIFALILWGWVVVMFVSVVPGAPNDSLEPLFWLLAGVGGLGALAMVLSLVLPEDSREAR